jgi:hypothetical protein
MELPPVKSSVHATRSVDPFTAIAVAPGFEMKSICMVFPDRTTPVTFIKSSHLPLLTKTIRCTRNTKKAEMMENLINWGLGGIALRREQALRVEIAVL